MSGALVASWGDVFAADATEACSIDILVASAARKGALSTTATSHASHRAWEAKRKCSYSGPSQRQGNGPKGRSWPTDTHSRLAP